MAKGKAKDDDEQVIVMAVEGDESYCQSDKESEEDDNSDSEKEESGEESENNSEAEQAVT